MSIKTYTEEIEIESVAKDLLSGVFRGLGSGVLIASLFIAWSLMYLATYEVLADAGVLSEAVWPATFAFWVDWAFATPLFAFAGAATAHYANLILDIDVEYSTAAMSAALLFSLFAVSEVVILGA